MRKEEIKRKVKELIAAGVDKSLVFTKLSGEGIKDKKLAYYIASSPDPHLRTAHAQKVKFLMGLLLVWALYKFVMLSGSAQEIGPGALWFAGGFTLLVSLLFMWGFSKPLASAYTLFIYLHVFGSIRVLEGFNVQPFLTAVVLGLNLGMIGIVFYVRQKLFPDLGILNPKKTRGRYVFSG